MGASACPDCGEIAATPASTGEPLAPKSETGTTLDAMVELLWPRSGLFTSTLEVTLGDPPAVGPLSSAADCCEMATISSGVVPSAPGQTSWSSNPSALDAHWEYATAHQSLADTDDELLRETGPSPLVVSGKSLTPPPTLRATRLTCLRATLAGSHWLSTFGRSKR